MKININNKVHIGLYNRDGKLIIPLNDKDDILYFQTWVNQLKSIIPKKDYVRNFHFTNGYAIGTLFNCQPILHKNLEWVELIHDYNNEHLELPCS